MGRKVGKAKKAGGKTGSAGRHSKSGRRSTGPPGLKLWEMLTLSDQTDEMGRLLLEDSAPDAAIARTDRMGIPRQTVVCPYADTPSRVNGLMNESAYEALRRDTMDILNGFGWLARNYLDMDDSREGSVQTLVDVSHLGLTLPLVLTGRASNPIRRKGGLPSYVASIFKASRGVFSAAVDMMNKHGTATKVTAAEVTSFADREGHLRRPQTHRVCAAPTRLIIRTVAVMLTAAGADPERSQLPDLIEFQELWEFYCLEAELSQHLSDYGFVLKNLAASSVASDPQDLFDSMVPVGDRLRPFGDYTEEVLHRANAAQAGLNHLLGRSSPPARITFNDLLRLI